MNKIVVSRPGGFRQLRLEAHASTPVAAGEVRVSTRAIGVNFADCVVRMGLYKSAREMIGFPITPGFEFAGVVDAVGDGVTDLAIGDPVFGVSLFGAYASEVVTPRELVRPLPPGLGMLEAGSFSVVFLTAWYALFQLGQLKPGERVLVHSAAGGVGSAACQLASAAGAHVVGVVGSAHKVEAARQNGAAEVIDKSREDAFVAARRAAPRGYDMILDANGARSLKKSYDQLAATGRLMVYGFHTFLAHGGLPNFFKIAWQYLVTPRFNPVEMVDRNVSIHCFNLSYLFEKRFMFELAMNDLCGQLATGKIRPLAAESYALAEAPAAHKALQSGKTVGKLVLLP